MGLNLHHLLAGTALCLALAGCTQHSQTTSGSDYLRAYAQESASRPAQMSSDVKAAAAVEPLLRFPARIGLARIGPTDRWGYSIKLTGIPEQEAVAWQGVASSLGPKFGEFVPVSPLIAEMFDDQRNNSSAREVVRKIQLAAARQHLDAVVIYESDGTADTSDNPLSIGNWTLIGAFVLPSQDVKARGVAQAMMIDVRNGYPYGTAQAEAKDTSLTTAFSTGDAKRDLAETVRLAAVQNLAPEVEKMMRNLRVELAEKREKPRGR